MVACCSRSMLLFVTYLPFFLIHVQIPFQRSCGWTEIVFSIDKKEVEREICAANNNGLQLDSLDLHYSFANNEY